MERFTESVRRIMARAQVEANWFGHEYIGTEHILLGLLEEDSAGVAILNALAIDPRGVRLEVERLLTRGPTVDSPNDAGKTPRAMRVIGYATEEARNQSNSEIGSGQLLLGMLREREGLAGQVLGGLGVNLDQVREILSDFRDPE